MVHTEGSTSAILTASGGVLGEFLTGLNLDERFSATASGVTQSYLTDALGSIVALANATGTTLPTTYAYSPFGATQQSGTTSPNPFQFTGRENDPTGLYYLRARYYNPAWGRFISEDPIGLNGGINLYSYTNNNPISQFDPYGDGGIGLLGSASLEGGVAILGSGVTVSAGGGLFWGGGHGVTAGAFASAGAFVGGPGYGLSLPSSQPQGTTAAVGSFGGGGIGIFFTNASAVGHLRGPFSTYSYNISLGPLQFSVQLGVSGGTWMASVTVGPGNGFARSSYPTYTVTTGSSSPGNEYNQTGTSQTPTTPTTPAVTCRP